MSVEDLAAYAGFSRFHFARIFSVATGEPLVEFLRRSRLGRAAARLAKTEEAVTDVAFASGYESASAFTRAFGAEFGITPSGYRAQHDAQRKDATLDIRYEVLQPMRLLAVKQRGPYSNAHEAWSTLVQRALQRKIWDRSVQRVGLSYDDPQQCAADQLRYEAAFVTDAPPDDVLHELFVAGGLWAVTTYTGPYELIGHAFDKLIDAVVLRGRRELRDAPALELYRNNPRDVAPSELRTDLALPIMN